MSIARRTITLIALVAYLALCTVGMTWVLCDGANGHVEFEALSAGCCGGLGTENESEHGSNDDCGDCTDTLLATLALAVEERGDDADVFDMSTLEPTAGQPATLGVSIRDVTEARHRAPPRPPPQHAMLHRAVVTCTVLRL